MPPPSPEFACELCEPEEEKPAQVCRNWARYGHCRFGDWCHFASTHVDKQEVEQAEASPALAHVDQSAPTMPSPAMPAQLPAPPPGFEEEYSEPQQHQQQYNYDNNMYHTQDTWQQQQMLPPAQVQMPPAWMQQPMPHMYQVPQPQGTPWMDANGNPAWIQHPMQIQHPTQVLTSA